MFILVFVASQYTTLCKVLVNMYVHTATHLQMCSSHEVFDTWFFSSIHVTGSPWRNPKISLAANSLKYLPFLFRYWHRRVKTRGVVDAAQSKTEVPRSQNQKRGWHRGVNTRRVFHIAKPTRREWFITHSKPEEWLTPWSQHQRCRPNSALSLTSHCKERKTNINFRGVIIHAAMSMLKKM